MQNDIHDIRTKKKYFQHEREKEIKWNKRF